MLFLAVLISTDLAGHMASSVDCTSITAYGNYMMIFNSFSLFFAYRFVEGSSYFRELKFAVLAYRNVFGMLTFF